MIIGIQKLYAKLEIKTGEPKKKLKLKTNLYIYGIVLLSVVFSMLIRGFIIPPEAEMC